MKLTQKQFEMLNDSIENIDDFPKTTKDPLVNYLVDCLVVYEEEKDAYIKEIKALEE